MVFSWSRPLTLRAIHFLSAVDDLDDISNLESWVDKSLLFVVLLSGSVDALGKERSDYFHSKNCLRELRHAVESGKEIVFVYEPKAEREGCTLHTHIAACPPDLRETLEGGYIIPWYRVRQFQQVSLLLLLKSVYAIAPSRKRRNDREHSLVSVATSPFATAADPRDPLGFIVCHRRILPR